MQASPCTISFPPLPTDGTRVHLTDWVSIAGLGVSVVGFSLTIWQLVRTANATRATAATIDKATRRMGVNHLLVLLPQLRMVENDLDAAIADNDPKLAARSLVSFSYTANQVASLLEGQDDFDLKFVELLRGSAHAASSAKSVLVTGTSRPVRTVVKSAVEDITAVSGRAAGLLADYQNRVA
jgi:hypothetical protein